MKDKTLQELAEMAAGAHGITIDDGNPDTCPWEAAVSVVVEECAKIADYWGSGAWRVQQEKRRRFDLHDLQVISNTTSRAIAEDIRKLTAAPAPRGQIEEAHSADEVAAGKSISEPDT